MASFDVFVNLRRFNATGNCEIESNSGRIEAFSGIYWCSSVLNFLFRLELREQQLAQRAYPHPPRRKFAAKSRLKNGSSRIDCNYELFFSLLAVVVRLRHLWRSAPPRNAWSSNHLPARNLPLIQLPFHPHLTPPSALLRTPPFSSSNTANMPLGINNPLPSSMKSKLSLYNAPHDAKLLPRIV